MPQGSVAGTEHYTIDPAGRLTDATNADGTAVTFGYDADDNRTRLTAGGTTTPNAEFTVTLTPQAADHGTWAWHYSIPQYGETHDAGGDYTIGTPAADGTRTVSMTGSNHVMSAQGTRTEEIPYAFDLVPSLNAACPVAP